MQFFIDLNGELLNYCVLRTAESSAEIWLLQLIWAATGFSCCLLLCGGSIVIDL